MKQLFFILSLLLLMPTTLRAVTEDELLIRLHPDRSEVYEGDSLLVSVVLYATSPIAKAECVKDFEVKGKCKVRRLNINREATSSRVREGNKIYYTLVWSQHVVTPSRIGTYTVQPQKFKATLRHVVKMPDWVDQMMGAKPEYREVKVSGHSESLKIIVKEKPLRSTEEMMKSAVVV